jgi:Fic family protein
LQLIETSGYLSLRHADILKTLLKESDRMFSIAEIKGKYNVAYDTARRDLQFLSDSGYIEKVQVGNKLMYRYPGRKD